MYPQIKNLVIILSILCFLVGCTQVKHIVTDVKEVFTVEKKDTPKAPEATDTGTTKEVSSPPPAKAKTKETKTTPPSDKKGTQKTTQPTAGEVFGPR